MWITFQGIFVRKWNNIETKSIRKWNLMEIDVIVKTREKNYRHRKYFVKDYKSELEKNDNSNSEIGILKCKEYRQTRKIWNGKNY